MSAKIGVQSYQRGMDNRAQIDFLATLRLSLKVLKSAEPESSVDELRRMIQARIAELKTETNRERKHAALEVKCPICGARSAASRLDSPV